MFGNCFKLYALSCFFALPRSKIEYAFDGATIVYCPTKKKTEAVAEALCGNILLKCVVQNYMQHGFCTSVHLYNL